MYVAVQELKERQENGRLRTVFPGEPVVTFEQWPVTNQVAALRSNLVRFVSDGALPADKSIHVRPTVEEAAAAHVAVLSKAAQDMQVRLGGAVPPEAPAAAAQEQPDQALAQCELCSYTCRTQHGISIHMGRAHRAG